MKLGHSREDCIVETGCKNRQVKPKKTINYSIDFVIDVINAEEVVSELVNGEIEFRLEDQQLVTLVIWKKKPKVSKKKKLPEKPQRTLRNIKGP